MNLYQTQHPFYCGIDLHANQMYACVIDQAGNKLLHKNFKTRQPEKLFAELAPYGSNVVVGCESTFNCGALAGVSLVFRFSTESSCRAIRNKERCHEKRDLSEQMGRKGDGSGGAHSCLTVRLKTEPS